MRLAAAMLVPALLWSGNAAAVPKFQEGQPAPWIAALDEHGTPLSLAKIFKTNPSVRAVVVQFWASWCKPCLKELDQLAAGRDALRKANLDIFLVNVADPEADRAVAALKARGLVDTHTIRDETGGIVESLGLTGDGSADGRQLSLPLSLLVIRENKRIVRIFKGAEHDYVAQLLAAVSPTP